jgi:hypothetical protein
MFTELAKQLTDAGETIGYRFCDYEVAVGDELDNSFVWDGDQKTDDELPGVCAFSTWEAIADYAKHSKGIGGKIVLVTGEFAGHGTDFADEIYVKWAEVVAVIDW